MTDSTKPRLSDLTIDGDARTRTGSGRRLKLVAAITIIVIAIAAILVVGRTSLATVEVSTARSAPSGGGATVLNASGYVEPRRKATVAAKITGRVTDVLVDEGMMVEKGQVLARLDDSDARSQFDAIKADRDVARATIDELEINLADAERTLRRTNELYEEGVASMQDLDSATAVADAFRAKLKVARKSLEAAEAQLAVSAQNLENYTIRAPFAGVAVSKDAQPGEMVSPVSAGGGFTRTGISTIVDMESLEIEVDVNESHIAKVRSGQPANAVLDAYPDWHIPATVRTIIPTADRQKATVKVRLTFDYLDPKILPDMGVKVAFREAVDDQESSASPQSLVPQPAIRSEDEQTVVFVLDGETLERRAVSTGRITGNEVEIMAGVAAGERVVVAGPASLADGQRVRIRQ